METILLTISTPLYIKVNGGVSLSGYLASLVCGISYSMLCLFMICLDFFYARYFGFNDIGTMLVGGHETSQLPLLTQLLTVLSYQYPIVILCIFSALFGTTLDSVLGAIFEYSGRSWLEIHNDSAKYIINMTSFFRIPYL